MFKTNNQTNRYKKIGICRQNQTGPNFFSLAMPWLRSLKSCLASFFLLQFSTQVIESAIYKIYLYLCSMYEKTYIWHQFLDEGDHSCHVMEDLHMLLFHPLDGESIIVLLLLNDSNLKQKAGHIISSSWYLSANQIQDKSCTSEQFSYLMIKVV